MSDILVSVEVLQATLDKVMELPWRVANPIVQDFLRMGTEGQRKMHEAEAGHERDKKSLMEDIEVFREDRLNASEEIDELKIQTVTLRAHNDNLAMEKNTLLHELEMMKILHNKVSSQIGSC
jgi:polyhydroxyalkanoate synthesis regulator phasin